MCLIVRFKTEYARNKTFEDSELRERKKAQVAHFTSAIGACIQLDAENLAHNLKLDRVKFKPRFAREAPQQPDKGQRAQGQKSQQSNPLSRIWVAGNEKTLRDNRQPAQCPYFDHGDGQNCRPVFPCWNFDANAGAGLLPPDPPGERLIQNLFHGYDANATSAERA